MWIVTGDSIANRRRVGIESWTTRISALKKLILHFKKHNVRGLCAVHEHDPRIISVMSGTLRIPAMVLTGGHKQKYTTNLNYFSFLCNIEDTLLEGAQYQIHEAHQYLYLL